MNADLRGMNADLRGMNADLRGMNADLRGRAERTMNSKETSSMKCPLFAVLSGLLLTAMVGCGKKEAPAPPPTEVKVATVLQKDVPVYVEAIGQTRGSTEIEVRARVEGFLADGRLQGRDPRHEGAAPLHDRPAALRGRRSRRRKGALAEAEAAARPRPAGRRALRAAGRQERDLAPGVRDGGGGPAGGRGRRGGRQGRRRRAPRSTSATRRWWRPRTAWSARPRSIRARWWGAGRARC